MVLFVFFSSYWGVTSRLLFERGERWFWKEGNCLFFGGGGGGSGLKKKFVASRYTLKF